MRELDMGERDFTLAGQTFRKRPQDFIDAVRGERPKTLQTWAVNIEGTPYPPKQVVARVTRLPKFTTHQANGVLRRFGFEPFTIGSEGSRPSLLRDDSIVSASADGDQQTPDVRLIALREAISFVSQRPGGTADDVLDAAEKFEHWLNR
jgi:hypothetical protein